MLILESVHTYYGHIHALKGVSLTVNEGEIVTLIGSNGAGKTTTLNTISGVLSARAGAIYLQSYANNGPGKSNVGHEQDIRLDKLPAHNVARLGVSQSPEGRKIFARLSVQENLAMAPSPAPMPMAFARTWIASSNSSHASRNASASPAAPCPAVNSRCWPSGVHS